MSLFIYTDSSKFPSKPCHRAVWFDTDCKESKRPYIDAMKDYNRCKTQASREKMCELKLNYKKTVWKKKRIYKCKQYKFI